MLEILTLRQFSFPLFLTVLCTGLHLKDLLTRSLGCGLGQLYAHHHTLIHKNLRTYGLLNTTFYFFSSSSSLWRKCGYLDLQLVSTSRLWLLISKKHPWPSLPRWLVHGFFRHSLFSPSSIDHPHHN